MIITQSFDHMRLLLLLDMCSSKRHVDSSLMFGDVWSIIR